jgi:hypothetical protein
VLTNIATEDLDVREKAAEFGFTVPDGLVLLPGNLATAQSREELTYEASSSTVRKLLVRAGLEVKALESKEGDAVPQHFQKNFDWLGPTIFFGYTLLTQNPATVTIALNMISTYLVEMFRGASRGQTVKLVVIVERIGKNHTKRIEYSGTAEGLKDLASVIERVIRNDRPRVSAEDARGIQAHLYDDGQGASAGCLPFALQPAGTNKSGQS